MYLEFLYLEFLTIPSLSDAIWTVRNEYSSELFHIHLYVS